MRLLLCTDLDRTLLPNGHQPESLIAREYFARLVSRPEVTLVFVTGRDRSLVEDAIHEYQLPRPDYVIADVGSTIYQVNHSSWVQLPQWDEQIGHDWQGKDHDDLHQVLSIFAELRLQEAAKQNTHKLSYYVSPGIDYQALINSMTERLEQENIHANLIWSVDEMANVGLLDILPASAGKRHAIEFLMRMLEINSSETIFAGDSGNDIAVMASPLQSVLVANASHEVGQQAVEQARLNDQQETLYLARGGFMGMNGNYSAGILEGVAHYMPEAVPWFKSDDKA